MTITLPKDVLDKLPAPDSGGIVRVNAGLKIDPNSGDVEIVEINDAPLPSDKETSDDKNPMPAESLPDLSQIPSGA